MYAITFCAQDLVNDDAIQGFGIASDTIFADKVAADEECKRLVDEHVNQMKADYPEDENYSVEVEAPFKEAETTEVIVMVYDAEPGFTKEALQMTLFKVEQIGQYLDSDGSYKLL